MASYVVFMDAVEECASLQFGGDESPGSPLGLLCYHPCEGMGVPLIVWYGWKSWLSTLPVLVWVGLWFFSGSAWLEWKAYCLRVFWPPGSLARGHAFPGASLRPLVFPGCWFTSTQSGVYEAADNPLYCPSILSSQPSFLHLLVSFYVCFIYVTSRVFRCTYWEE